MTSALFYFSTIVLTLSAATCPYDSVTSGCSNSKYMIEGKVCADICPSLFTITTNNSYTWCTTPSYADAVLFELEFSVIKDLTATYIASSTSPSEYFVNPGSIQYNSPTQKSPLPTIDRGFYFVKTSSIISNESHIPGLYFTLNIWIKPLDSGEILNVIMSSNSYIRIWADSGFYKFSVLIYDDNNNAITVTAAATSAYTSSWHTVSMIIYQDTCNMANMFYYIDYANVGSAALMNSEVRFPNGIYTWTIGNLIGGNSFRGFIYWLQARADNIQSSTTITITINCVDNQYWDGSSCQNCDTSCSDWPWCVRGTDCSYCYTQDCASCAGYLQSMCTECTTGVPPGCCDVYGTTCTQTWTNSECTSGMILIEGVCLYACPYGFDNCTAVSSAVITADFTGAFAGSYGSDLITGISASSYNYWNSPEPSDPFPAINRGLYFNSNQYLSGLINLSNTWTMSMWVYAISGTLISHSSGELTIDSSGTINFVLEKWDGSSASYSTSQSITQNSWRYVSYSVGFANKVTTVTPYLNKIAGTSKTVTNYVFRLSSGGILYIGKGPINFKGFIAYFILWQVAFSDFSLYYDINTLTGGLVSLLWPCGYSHYYNGSTCQACSGSCTNGCTRALSCYICDDFLCSQCSSFWSGACTSCIPNASGTPCSCSSGFYQPTNQALCSACYTGCAHCISSSFYLCTSCSSGYSLYNSALCLPDCPTGYIANAVTGTCDFSSLLALTLSFGNEILLGQISGSQVGYSSSNIYPNYDIYDPFPSYLRGYYFSSLTSLRTMIIMLAPNFSISLWIKVTSAGLVMQKSVPSLTWSLNILSSGCPTFTISLYSINKVVSVSGSSSVLNSWFFISFDGKINPDGTITINFWTDSASQVTSTPLSPIFLLDSKGSFVIGNEFSGFLWELKIYSQNNHALDDWKAIGCSGNCSKCPIDSFCPDNCPISQYYDGSSCSNCIATCTKGCRNDDTCRLCKTKECATCTEFSGANSCLTCIANAISDGNGGCTCLVNTFWVLSTQTCELCDSACSSCLKTAYFECSACSGGFQLVENVCLYECPYNTFCSVVTTPVIDLSFDADFQGSYGIFTTGTSPTTFQFFNSPEITDPIPTYKRGLYFDGTMSLISSTTVYLSHSFSIGVWQYVINDGVLLYKQNLLTVSASGYTTAIMTDPLLATSIQAISISTSFVGWSYLSVTFQYSLGSTTVSIYINGISSSTVTKNNKIYRDKASSYLMLGKGSSPGFVGFIYYFQLWNTPIASFSAIISSFTFCGLGNGASCLWSCNISSYYNGVSYTACNSCIRGCRRANTCNICDDTLCSVCTGFSTGKCILCVANATLVSGSCVCNTNYSKSADGFSCVACFSGCSLCTDSAYNKCTACSFGFYFYADTGQCLIECPSGYTPNATTKICDFLSEVGISLDLTDQIRLDTVSGFDVGTNHLNSYPDWSLDANDPIPSIQRGYYFASNDYLSASVMIAPSFTISLWTKPLKDGILMVKFTSAIIIRIDVDLTGYPKLLISYADLSSKTIMGSTSIINSWHFLSFTGQVQVDGKTALNIYINNAVSSSSITTTALTYFKDTNTGKLYIGNDQTFGTSGLSGFFARLIIYNSYNYQSIDYDTSSCVDECSVCPSDHQCLSECAVNEYPDNCVACLNGCNEGCVSDLTCRLCRDKECYSCTTFTGECTSCIPNAYKLNGHCNCNPNAVWVSSSQSCELCNSACLTCSSPKYNGCLTCPSSYYLIQSLCMPFCPSGYSQSGSNCLLVQEKIFDLDLNTLNGVIFDKASKIPVVTGSTKQFYPNYESDDPIPAYLRGFYFNGQSSVLRMPEYSNYTSPRLVIFSIFTISIWLNTESSDGTLLSKQSISDNYSTLYSIFLMNKSPSISCSIGSFQLFYICGGSLNNYEWSHIVFTLEITENGYSKLSCYINGLPDSPGISVYRAFQDIGPHTTMSIGAQLGLSSVYNFYQGFIYQIQIFNAIKPISSLSTTSCTESCSVCPINKICIPNCKINEYWAGPSYNTCYKCNIKCKNSCRDWRSDCSLCSDLLCDTCTDYSLAGCQSCKENAINPDSCICDINYALDSSNNSTCISVKSGWFRGPDGKMYPCPDLCTCCESLTKCNSCVENASLKSDLCYCNLGYNGTKNCTVVLFSANLTVFSDNSLALTFSENLANSLTAYDFTITLEKQGKVAHKMESANSTCYYISLNILKAVSKGTLAILEFLNVTEVRSISNGILNSSIISVSLNSYDPEPFLPDIATISSQATAGVQTTVAGALALSIISSNPSSLWSMMNNLQILSYLTLSGIPFSNKMRTFLINLNSFNLLPNMFTCILDKNEGSAPYPQAQEFGYDTDLILISAGNDFTVILASLSALPIILFFSRCSHRWIGKKFMKALKAYQFAFYLRFWIQCYLELGAAASIGLVTFGIRNETQITNFVICIAVSVLLALTPPLYFWFSYKNRNRIQTQEKTFMALFSPFFYEFRVDRGFLATQYYFVFFMRRLIYIINLIYLREYPQTEVTINIVLSLMTIMHLIFFWPFEDSILQISNLLTEIMICLVMVSTAAYLFNSEQEIISAIENVIIGIAIGVILVQAFSSIAIFARTLYRMIYRKLTKAGIVKNSVQPLSKHFKKTKINNL